MDSEFRLALSGRVDTISYYVITVCVIKQLKRPTYNVYKKTNMLYAY